MVLTAAALAGLGMLLVYLVLRAARAAGERTDRRKAWFDRCLPLLSDVRIGAADHGFARLNGRYDCRLFDLQALPDALGYRKLPTLWLLVSVPEAMPLAGTLDIMVRPTGTDVFSRFESLPVRIETPPGFPANTAIRADHAAAVPSDVVLDLLRAAFFSPRVKEVVLSPKGVRLVWTAEEADRSRYLIYRDSELGHAPLDPATLEPLLDIVAGLARALAAGERR